MDIITSLEQLHRYDVPCVVALGTFDGLHCGHMDVIRSAKAKAEASGAKLAVFTFSNHPFACFRPDNVPPALITPAQKHNLLASVGVDVLVDIPFDHSVASLEPAAFLEKLAAIGYSCLVVGSNFTYGIRGEGTVATLRTSAEQLGFELIVRDLVADGATVISSTAIRQLIAAGDVKETAVMLGRMYSLTGIVAHGNERGRLLGYPTANIELTELAQGNFQQKAQASVNAVTDVSITPAKDAAQAQSMAIPAGGVYAVRALVRGKVYGAMANIGKNPTFGDVAKPRLETHIFDFSGDIYGEEITIEFVERVRGEVKFGSLDELQKQLRSDEERCRALLESLSLLRCARSQLPFPRKRD